MRQIHFTMGPFSDFPWGDDAETLDALQQSFLIMLLNAHRSHHHSRKEQFSGAKGEKGKVLSVGAIIFQLLALQSSAQRRGPIKTTPNSPHIIFTYTKFRFDHFWDQTYTPSWSKVY